jgi:hypothetical protein
LLAATLGGVEGHSVVGQVQLDIRGAQNVLPEAADDVVPKRLLAR